MRDFKFAHQFAFVGPFRKEVADLKDLFRVEFNHWVVSTSRPINSIVSAFCNTVFSVISLGPREQMDRSKAWRIVAAMKSARSFFEQAVCSLVGQPVGVEEFLCIGVPYFPVSIVGSGSRPFEAWVRTPILRRVITKIADHGMQQVETVNIVVSHLSALPWRRCLAVVAFPRYAAFSILPEGVN